MGIPPLTNTGSSLPKKLSGPKLMGSKLGEYVKIRTPYLFLQPLKLATSNLVYNLGLGSSLPRNNFYDQNWWVSGLGEYPKKIWDPYLFLQQLKLATSNLVYNLRLEKSLPRNNFYDQNWQVSGLGEHPKNWGPVLIFAAIDASKFKFAIQLGLWQWLTKKQQLRTKTGGRLS